MGPRNRFQGMNSASLCSLAGRYDNPIPTRFLAPIECLEIPALCTHQEDPLKPVGADAHDVLLCRCRIAVQGHDAVTVI
jgi:hypothetical protein